MGKQNYEHKESVGLEERLNHVCSSLFFCSQAVHELRTLTTRYELSEANFLTQKPPFNFYKASLMYLIILEYCKLFYPKETRDRLSSIYNLWDESCKLYPGLDNESNRLAINSLEINELTMNIKMLRDKRFAHSDQHDLNKLFNIKVFTEDEQNELASQMNIAFYLLNEIHQCAKGSDLLFPHHSTGVSQTRSFIHEASIALAFYYKNQTLANSQGFQIYQHRIIS
jgi:hypothetical protein